MDLVSVIIPYYKKKSSILYSVNSVLNQTYTNFEIIIIYDDNELMIIILVYIMMMWSTHTSH